RGGRSLARRGGHDDAGSRAYEALSAGRADHPRRRGLGLALLLREPRADQAVREGPGAQPAVHGAGIPGAAAQSLAGALAQSADRRGSLAACHARIPSGCAASCSAIIVGTSQSMIGPTPSCVPPRIHASASIARRAETFARRAARNAASPATSE